jgi:hypothetical protein
MKTEARLDLSLRQRRFEWALARDEQGRTAQRLVAGKTHDLLNLIQIIRLGARLLDEHCDARARELIADLERSADDSQRALAELMALARPAAAIAHGAPVGETVAAAVAALGAAIALDARIEARIEAPPGAATRATAPELEHLVIGLVLDAADALACGSPPIELAVRARAIAGAPWIELVRGARPAPPGDRFELRVARAIAERAGGTLTIATGRGGCDEVIVALPAIA